MPKRITRSPFLCKACATGKNSWHKSHSCVQLEEARKGKVAYWHAPTLSSFARHIATHPRQEVEDYGEPSWMWLAYSAGTRSVRWYSRDLPRTARLYQGTPSELILEMGLEIMKNGVADNRTGLLNRDISLLAAALVSRYCLNSSAEELLVAASIRGEDSMDDMHLMRIARRLGARNYEHARREAEYCLNVKSLDLSRPARIAKAIALLEKWIAREERMRIAQLALLA